ncbi:MAG: hypothetical protein HXK79_06750 [Lachnospiraceae bacterium]|nr:hypothetical protein [Lachnospiraceae bacterium]
MLKTRKTKIFTAILSATLFISGISTMPVYAKGLSKAVKKEYVKILKKHILKTNEEREAAGYPASCRYPPLHLCQRQIQGIHCL